MNSLGSGSSPGVAGIPEAAGSGEGTVDPESGGEGGAGGQHIETRLVGWQDIWGGARGRPEGEREADWRMHRVWPGLRGSHEGARRLGYPSAPLDSST